MKSRLTAEQAVQIASDFCQRIHAPIHGPATAAFPKPCASFGQGSYCHQPRWEVAFNPVAVDVVDTTGCISSYWKPDVSDPEGPMISEAEAIRIATEALQATGHQQETQFDYAECDEFNREWCIAWRRGYEGIPYANDNVEASIQAVTGEVSWLSCHFRCPPPLSPSVTISRQQAENTARALMASVGLQNVPLTDARTEVVIPNTGWWNGGTEQPIVGPGRVAWTIFFVTGAFFYDVWVDAQTGQLIGGEYSASA